MDDRDAQVRVDADLVERAVRHADARAFELLVRRHQRMVRSQLRRLVRDNAALADDLAQDTFVQAWRKLEQFRGDSRFSTWLHRIAHTCFLQHLRGKEGQAGQQGLHEPDEAETLRADPATPELKLDMDAALKRLSENQRVTILYCIQLGLSHEEAAEVLDMPLGSVKTHVARGKARLRELLQDWAQDE